MKILNFFKNKKANGYEIKKHINTMFNETIDTEEWVAIYDDGRKIRFTVKSLYPLDAVDGIPMFNAYGQEVFNNYFKEKGIPQNHWANY